MFAPTLTTYTIILVEYGFWFRGSSFMDILWILVGWKIEWDRRSYCTDRWAHLPAPPSRNSPTTPPTTPPPRPTSTQKRQRHLRTSTPHQPTPAPHQTANLIYHFTMEKLQAQLEKLSGDYQKLQQGKLVPQSPRVPLTGAPFPPPSLTPCCPTCYYGSLYLYWFDID